MLLLVPVLARAADSPAPPYGERWKGDTGEAIGGAIVVGTSALVVGGSAIHAIDVNSGIEVWSLERNGGVLVTPAVGTAGGRTLLVYVERSPGGATGSGGTGEASPSPGATTPADVVAIDLEDRSERWRERLDAGISAGVTVAGDSVVLVSADGTLSTLSLEDGSTRWTDDRVGASDAAPTVSGEIVYAAGRVGTGASRVSAFDLLTGERLWSRTPSSGATSTSVVTVDDGLAVVAGSDRLVHALDATTGEERWSALMVNIPSPVAIPLVSDGSVYMTDYAGGIYRFDAESGERIWDHQLNSVAVRSSLVRSGEALIMGTNDGRLISLDSDDGHLRSDLATGSGLLGAIAIHEDLLIVPKGGTEPGLIAFGNDPEGTLLDVASPTEVDLSALFTRFALAAALVMALIALSRVAGRRRRGPISDPPNPTRSEVAT